MADDKDSLLSYFIITCYIKSYDTSTACEPNRIWFEIWTHQNKTFKNGTFNHCCLYDFQNYLCNYVFHFSLFNIIFMIFSIFFTELYFLVGIKNDLNPRCISWSSWNCFMILGKQQHCFILSYLMMNACFQFKLFGIF